MTTEDRRRRAVVVGRYNTDTPDLDGLVARHHLKVVFTITAPSAPKLATLIAVQHLFEHDAEVVVLPHLSAAEIRAERCWLAVSGLADILAADGGWLR
ncbi:hypothetical protein [Nocardia rhamnosiphila]|uniref:hypothetical protein n=1 Tax=Nocardia rhamnosiphila TaxID=426716 RepID=UPI0004C41F50|nr:hypothetical protein [Nocardia rhamnosiphila]